LASAIIAAHIGAAAEVPATSNQELLLLHPAVVTEQYMT
jgi:hypothetical protein